jgi:hypothetical protein
MTYASALPIRAYAMPETLSGMVNDAQNGDPLAQSVEQVDSRLRH